MTQRKKAKLIP